jgi:hypothetical protein
MPKRWKEVCPPRQYKYVREVFCFSGNAKAERVTVTGKLRRVWVHGRYQFQRTGFRSFTLPWPSSGPEFIAAYYIALQCQAPVAPDSIDVGLAVKIAVRGDILFDSRPFQRLKPELQARFRHLLNDFCVRVGGPEYRRAVPTVNTARTLRIRPADDVANRYLRQLPELFRQAIAMPSSPYAYTPPARIPRHQLREGSRLLKLIRQSAPVGAPNRPKSKI